MRRDTVSLAARFSIAIFLRYYLFFHMAIATVSLFTATNLTTLWPRQCMKVQHTQYIVTENCCCGKLLLNYLLAASYLTLTTSVSDISFNCSCTISLVSGMIFFNAGGRDDSISTNFQSHFGAISSILMSAMFGPAQVVLLEFPLKRPMFMREFATGTCTFM